MRWWDNSMAWAQQQPWFQPRRPDGLPLRPPGMPAFGAAGLGGAGRACDSGPGPTIVEIDADDAAGAGAGADPGAAGGEIPIQMFPPQPPPAQQPVGLQTVWRPRPPAGPPPGSETVAAAAIAAIAQIASDA